MLNQVNLNLLTETSSDIETAKVIIKTDQTLPSNDMDLAEPIDVLASYLLRTSVKLASICIREADEEGVNKEKNDGF